MPELVELRDAVRASAERRWGPRRRARRIRRGALVLAALAAIVGPVLLTDTASDERAVPPGGTPPPSTTPPPGRIAGHQLPEPRGTETPASARAAIADAYAIFDRPPRAADRVDDEPPRSSLREVDYDPADVRRLAVFDDYTLYGLPAVINGHAVLCTSMRNSRGIGGASCAPFVAADVHTRPIWQRTTFRGGPVFSLVLPDGTDRVTVHLQSGATRTVRVQDNAVLFQIRGLERISWRDATGAEHSTRARP